MSNERRQKLKPETTAKIAKIDNSIVYWSLQFGQITMKLREVEAQIGGLYDFKKTAVLEDLKSQNIDIEDCDITTVDAETVMIEKKPAKPQGFVDSTSAPVEDPVPKSGD
jgi:hypothetical protein